MNEKFHNYIQKAGKDISLTSAERERMRHTLHAYMDMKPVRTRHITSTSTQSWFFSMRPVAAVLVLVLFVSSAGMSYAAEDALPGDILYAIKTKLNEPVREALAISAEAKVAWATDVAGERVKEAATLAAEGRLDTATQEKLQADFEVHAQKATEAIGSQADNSPDTGTEAAVRFEAQLSEYEHVLAQVGEARELDVTALVSSVRSEGDRIAMIRTRAETRIAESDEEVHTSARMQVAAKRQLTDSSELARAGAKSLSPSSSDLVALQLESASATISAGEGFAQRNATSSALGAFRSALSATEKLGVFLKTSTAIHARTGLVVAEPKIRKTEQNTRSAYKKEDSSDRREEQVMTMAATLAAPESLPTATSSATTTVPESSNEADVRAEEHADLGDDKEARTESGRTLPVAVPIHIPF